MEEWNTGTQRIDMFTDDERYKIDESRRVYVYKNLHNGLWSILGRKTRLVVGHAKHDEDADPYTAAVEFFSFNTEGSWVGEQTPIIIASFSE